MYICRDGNRKHEKTLKILKTLLFNTNINNQF